MAGPSIVQVVGGAGHSFATAAGTAVGDYLVAFQATGLTGAGPPAQPGGTYTSGWTVLADLTSLSNGKLKAWYRLITDAGGAKTVTVTGGNATYGDYLAVAVVRNASDVSFLDGTVATVYSASSAALTIPAGITTTIAESHLIAFWFVQHVTGSAGTGSPPGSMIEQLDSQTSMSGCWVGTEILTAAGAVGSRVLTSSKTPSSSYPSGGIMFAARQAALPVSMTDSATGSDTFTPAPSVGASDSAAGSETFGITASTSSTNTATGTETFGITASTSASDSATGSESFTIQVPTAVPASDTATGSETFGITAIRTAVTDTATGSETFGILRQSVITDTAVGSETFGMGPIWGDTALGSDTFSVIEIVQTRVLPRRTERIYELVVVARIPQSAGPPSLVEVDAIRWSSLAYTDTVGEPQDLTVQCLISTVPEEILQRFRDLRSFPTELWLRRSGQIIAAGPVLGGQLTGQKLTLHSAGLLRYLARMRLDADAQYLGVDQALVAKDLVDRWQSSSSGHYGIDTSRIAPTGRPIDVTYLRDELPVVLRVLTEAGRADGGYDLEVDPASRQLIVWSPARGVDRSAGEDAVVLDSRNVTSPDLVFSAADEDLASDAFVTGSKSGGDAPLFSSYSNPDVRAQYGRGAVSATFSNVADQAQLDALAKALQVARSKPLIIPGPKLRVTDDADVTAYREGDTVFLDLAGPLSFSGPFRIKARTVSVDETGRESVDLEST